MIECLKRGISNRVHCSSYLRFAHNDNSFPLPVITFQANAFLRSQRGVDLINNCCVIVLQMMAQCFAVSPHRVDSTNVTEFQLYNASAVVNPHPVVNATFTLLDLVNDTGAPLDARLSESGTTQVPHAKETSSSPGLQFAQICRMLQPLVCACGICGNILTLCILARRRLKLSCDGTEQAVHVGLGALAISDLLFCISLFPYILTSDAVFFTSKNFDLYYRTYSNAIVNTFILISTWLTVTMALSRYLAICHPFRCQHLVDPRTTKFICAIVCAICTLFSIPRFFLYTVQSLNCVDGTPLYVRWKGLLPKYSGGHNVYMWLYFSVGVAVPLCTLGFCNVSLVKALQESVKVRREYRVPAAHINSNHRITSILVTVVVMYIVLVSPAEILVFVHDRLPPQSQVALKLPIQLTNLLQSINFSLNFILYFILNTHFRRELREIITRCFAFCLERRVKGNMPRTLSNPTSQTPV